MFRMITYEQGTEKWLQWRRGGVGGSDMVSLLGLSNYADSTPDKLYLEKLGLFKKDQTFAMRRGIFKEPETRGRVGAILRKKFHPACAEHLEAPWIRSSLDGVEADATTGGKLPILLEIKWLKFDLHELAIEGFVPPMYLAQIQWQLLVTGFDTCFFCSQSEHSSFSESERLVMIPVQADAERQAELMEIGEVFWNRVINGRKAMAEGRDPSAFMPEARG